MNDSLTKALEDALSLQEGKAVHVLTFHPVGGGCINESFRIKTSEGDFFMKWNEKDRYPRMFESEAKGLRLLNEANALYIPEVIAQGEAGNTSFLILEWIESGKRMSGFWKDFGENLASLHRHSAESFGLGHDNYIGSLKQSNKQHTKWVEFFIDERLQPQIALALNSKRIDHTLARGFEKLYSQLDKLIPDEKPSLLHGDLWNGNYLVNRHGSAALIDPAVYYGHREMDLAMTRLFGGFDEEFYDAYQNEYPLEPDFEERMDLHNLYPLLVHVNLFRGGYAAQVMQIVKRYV